MASLPELPNELKELVFADLGFSEFLSLSATCKILRATTLPALYHTLPLEWTKVESQEETSLKSPGIHKLLRTLIENPHYIKWVKSLEFCATGCLKSQEDGPIDIDIPGSEFEIEGKESVRFEKVIDDLGIQEAGKWKNALGGKDNLHIIMVLLIGTCTHLDSLSIAVDLLLRNDWFPAFVKQSISATPSAADAPSWLHQLSCLSVTSDMEGKLWGSELLSLQPTFLLFFYIPTLTTLELTAFADAETNDIELWEYEPPSHWPLDKPPTAVNLTTLRLMRSSVISFTIELMLKQAPNLQNFEYDCFKHPYNVPLDLSSLNTALQHVHNTLTHLTVRYELYHNEEDYIIAADTFNSLEGSLGPLINFPVLISLSTSMPVLYGYESTIIGQIPRLGDFLAPNLQHLTITDDLYMHGEFQQYFEDINGLKILHSYLTGGKVTTDWHKGVEYLHGGDNWRSGLQYERIQWVEEEEPEWRTATPLLKTFTYDLRKKGDESFGYWNVKGLGLKGKKKPRKMLEEACKAQGIIGEVLWEDE